MDINMAVHDLLETGGSGDGVSAIRVFERMLNKALEDYVPRSEFYILLQRVERLEKVLETEPWEVEFTMKYDGTNSVRLADVLTESQLYGITDEAAGGPKADGHQRTIVVYLVTDNDQSILLPWGTYGDVNTKSVEALNEAGVNYFPSGLYYLDGEGVLQCNIQKDTRFRIARLATPIA